MIIDTWETDQGGNADKNDTATENPGNSSDFSWSFLSFIEGR
jgi:hypothetical protein